MLALLVRAHRLAREETLERGEPRGMREQEQVDRLGLRRLVLEGRAHTLDRQALVVAQVRLEQRVQQARRGAAEPPWEAGP